jgi:hypothetical protein
MKKIKSTYHFSEPYIHWSKEPMPIQEATVKLEINYSDKSYSITPSCGTKDFEFRQCSHKKDMWIAILTAIRNAIEYAEKEISNS